MKWFRRNMTLSCPFLPPMQPPRYRNELLWFSIWPPICWKMYIVQEPFPGKKCNNPEIILFPYFINISGSNGLVKKKNDDWTVRGGTVILRDTWGHLWMTMMIVGGSEETVDSLWSKHCHRSHCSVSSSYPGSGWSGHTWQWPALSAPLLRVDWVPVFQLYNVSPHSRSGFDVVSLRWDWFLVPPPPHSCQVSGHETIFR